MTPSRPVRPGRAALLAQRVISGTDRGPLRRLWRLAYEAIARVTSAWLTVGIPGAAAYVRGSVAHGDALHGVSDIDVIVVVPGDPTLPGHARRRVEARWGRLAGRVPALGELVSVAVYEDSELAVAVRAPALTWPGSDAVFARSPYLEDALWLRVRPGIAPAPTDWRKLRGRERRPAAAVRSAQDERVAAWLELQWWWRHALAACSDPAGPRTRYLLVKFVAEPCRLLLRVRHGERVDARRAVLERSLHALPEEEDAIRQALALLDALPQRPVAPIGTFLPHLVRLSARLAATLAEQVADAGSTAVQLVGAEADAGGSRPLADWRALCVPTLPGERVLVLAGALDDPVAVAAAAAAPQPAGTLPALRHGDLLAVPLRDLWRSGFLRTLHCPLTDPVGFAAGPVAHFPEAAGWSAADLARRAEAERAARLAQAGSAAERLDEALGLGRAILLRRSLAEGAACLAVTPAATARMLAETGLVSRGAGEAAAAWSADRRDPPPDALGRELAAAVSRARLD